MAESGFDLKQVIKDYIAFDDQLTELNKQVKEIRTSKVNFENIIKQHMIDGGIAQLNTKNGSIKVSKSKVTKKLNKKVISELLSEMLDEEKANTILETLFDDTDLDEVTKLEFKKNKK